MAFGRARPFAFLAGVVDLERLNRQAIDHEPGRFGMQRCGGVWQSLGREPIDEGAIEIFCEVIAQLVGGVDPPFDIGQRRIGCTRSARLVLNVPEIEVGSMLACYAPEEGFFQI